MFNHAASRRQQQWRVAPGRRSLLLGALLLASIVFVSATGAHAAQDAIKTADDPAPGGDVKAATPSLSLVPADASVYVSLLRNKQQLDLFLKSNAYKTLRSLPYAKIGHKMLMDQLGKEDGPLEKYKEFVKDKDNAALMEVLADAVSEEVFFFGGKAWSDFIKVSNQVNYAQQMAPLKAVLENSDPNKAQIRAVLQALQQHREKLRVPELVMGFKVKDGKKANHQIDRLEKLAGALIEKQEKLKEFKGKLKRTKIGDDSFLTLEVDGSMIPWDEIPFKDYEDKQDEFADLIKQLKKLTLSVSLGVKGEYLLLGISSSAKDLENIGGKNKSLASVKELAPLAKHAKKPLTGISYASKEFLQAMTGTRADLDTLGKFLKEALEKAPMLKAERKKAIEKDVDAFIDEAKKSIYEPGSQLSYSFMTPTGYEAFDYDFGKHDDFKGVNTKLLQHVGGDPIFAAALGMKCEGQDYKTLVKWAKKIYGHAEAAFLDQAQQEDRNTYQKIAGAVMPLLQKLDDTTTKSLIPALKETGLGIVLDSKWASKQWHKTIPAMPKEMPMLELGLLVGVSDAKKFTQAMKEYRTTINEIIEKVRDNVPNKDDIPAFKIPDPQQEKVGKDGAALFFYSIPEAAGLDKQVQPVMAVGKGVSLITLSKKHAERLLAPTPLKFKSGPLAARKGDLIGGSVLNWPALVDLAEPWLEFSASAAVIVPGDDEEAAKRAKKQIADIMKQVKVGLEVLKCFKGSSSATYLEDGKLVTHSEVIIKDLEKGTDPE